MSVAPRAFARASRPAPPRRGPGRGGVLAAAAAAVLALAAAGAAPRGAALPVIVFVSRAPLPDAAAGAVPGLGPHHRAAAAGGRLLVRERDGEVRDLLGADSPFDVADPSVSPDGRRVAFAALAHPDSAWRLWIVGLDGADAAPVTFTDGALARHDDLDPCWTGERTIVFASTRWPLRSQYADVPVPNLFALDLDSGRIGRLTSERNGADEPAWDARRGRIVYARWWFNRWGAADPIAPAAAPAAPDDSANVWHAVSIRPDGSGLESAAGSFRHRRDAMLAQPAVLADGSLAGVYAANLGLSPAPIALGIHRFPARHGPPVRVAGAIVAAAGADPYADARGLAAPSACAPAALPDGRIAFAWAPGARGDFGLHAAGADGAIERLVDLPGTLELDPAVARAWPRGAARARVPVERLPDAAARPAASAAELAARPGRFRYLADDVYAPPPGARRSAPARARLRVYALLAGPDGEDRAALIAEAPVGRDGRVDLLLPAHAPLFEQVVDDDGRVLRGAAGPLHVAGSNAGVAGGTSRCVGCHVGHSTRVRAAGR